MLYIHKLSDLNVKSAEIESLQFIRDIRQRASFPLTEQKLAEFIAGLFVTENDLQLVERSIAFISPAILKLKEIFQREDKLNEPVNIRRATQSLSSLIEPLSSNLAYANQTLLMQREFLANVAALLNSIPPLKTDEEKAAANTMISGYFERILRSKSLSFNYRDIVSEAQTILIKDIVEGFKNGYIFHFTLEDEIRKATFVDVRVRIPLDQLREYDELTASIRAIKEGVDHAYDLNMRMISWAVAFLSLIKWLASK